MANTKPKSTADELVEDEAAAKEVISPKEIDPEQYVIVRNGFHGKLIYKSSRSGEKFVWSDFGDEQEMQLRELRNAKNSFTGVHRKRGGSGGRPYGTKI